MLILFVGIFMIGVVSAALTWQDMSGNVITSAEVGDTVRMVSLIVGSDEFILCNDNCEEEYDDEYDDLNECNEYCDKGPEELAGCEEDCEDDPDDCDVDECDEYDFDVGVCRQGCSDNGEFEHAIGCRDSCVTNFGDDPVDPDDYSVYEFDVLEDDLADDDIRVGDEAIGGFIEDGKYVAYWTITPRDFAIGAANVADGEGYDTEFYFKVDGEDSGDLNVDRVHDNSPMGVRLVSPECGANFSVDEDVEINVSASDADDYINGTVSINGVVNRTFSNGGVVFDYSFDSDGSYQIVVDAVNSRGKRLQDVANVMVLGSDGVYLAACISSPEDFSNIEDSFVHFDTSTTRAVVVVNGSVSEFTPIDNPKRFSWYWRFLPEDVVYEFVKREDPLAYNFSVEFPVAGGNSASLRVEFD